MNKLFKKRKPISSGFIDLGFSDYVSLYFPMLQKDVTGSYHFKWDALLAKNCDLFLRKSLKKYIQQLQNEKIQGKQ